jgi:hypothetical protein
VKSVGIAGVTGFGGGFGKHALAPWGEPVIKQFVHAAVEEALKLEKALARLRSQCLIALMHYSPVQRTVDGEPLEIYPFLGSSRLEEPIGRYPVSLVFHGHAHRGQPEGTDASSGVAVYNVSLPLLTRAFPDRLPFSVSSRDGVRSPKRDIPQADPVLPRFRQRSRPTPIQLRRCGIRSHNAGRPDMRSLDPPTTTCARRTWTRSVPSSASSIPFLIGGSHGLVRYLEVERETKTWIAFICPGDVHRTLSFFRSAAASRSSRFPSSERSFAAPASSI